MNLGQISLKRCSAPAGKKLGMKFASPIFDGAPIDKINDLMKQAGLPENGRTYLYDGGTCKRFAHQPATVRLYCHHD
ncbi:MAG: hypothetical protein U5L09_14450 [Bacteroidales bacterium]|nr:hypothetical protein [Bacteroidales bacterium]